ncbi:hypothetical protein VNO77_19254 [Canavalia gladiata]|uniref:Tripeptidyl peptidase II second Ig-like domain-containing protein n=1 Tax=Canavalia gladiata TaxID=3824 RepID=A0AAN9LS88_CANGL
MIAFSWLQLPFLSMLQNDNGSSPRGSLLIWLVNLNVYGNTKVSLNKNRFKIHHSVLLRCCYKHPICETIEVLPFCEKDPDVGVTPLPFATVNKNVNLEILDNNREAPHHFMKTRSRELWASTYLKASLHLAHMTSYPNLEQCDMVYEKEEPHQNLSKRVRPTLDGRLDVRKVSCKKVAKARCSPNLLVSIATAWVGERQERGEVPKILGWLAYIPWKEGRKWWISSGNQFNNFTRPQGVRDILVREEGEPHRLQFSFNKELMIGLGKQPQISFLQLECVSKNPLYHSDQCSLCKIKTLCLDMGLGRGVREFWRCNHKAGSPFGNDIEINVQLTPVGGKNANTVIKTEYLQIANSPRKYGQQSSYCLKDGAQMKSHIPLLNGRMYDTKFESQFYMISDSNNRIYSSGNVYPKSSNLPKGEYNLQLYLRHDNVQILEKMRHLVLFIEEKDVIRLNFVSQPDGPLIGNGSVLVEAISYGKLSFAEQGLA